MVDLKNPKPETGIIPARFTFLLLFTLIPTLTGCAPEPVTIPPAVDGTTLVNVSLTEFGVHLEPDFVPVGNVRFIITNIGSVEHNLYLEPVGAIEEPFLNQTEMPAFVEGLQAGDVAAIDFVFENAGEQYQLGCHLPGHYEAGMVTTFNVSS